MRQERDEEEQTLIACVNHECASNGGSNASALLATREADPEDFTKAFDLTFPKLGELAADLELKPMSSAPKPGPTEHFKILALDEWSECGMKMRGWALLYWLDEFDGRAEGWHGTNCGDRRHPVGWVLTTKDLPGI